MTIEPIFIDELIAADVALISAKLLPTLQAIDNNITGVHFFHGHPLEIQKELQLLSQGTTTKTERYPAVWLFRDFRERKNPTPGIYAKHKLKLFIATRTVPTYDSNQRKEKSFKPILYPIYNELMAAFDQDSKIVNAGYQRQQLDTIDHYFWGKEGLFGNTDKNYFTDWIDCIEIEEIELQTYLKKC